MPISVPSVKTIVHTSSSALGGRSHPNLETESGYGGLTNAIEEYGYERSIR